MRRAAPALLLLAGCAGTAVPESSDRFCATRVEIAPAPVAAAGPGQAQALRDSGFSADAIETAEAIGALDALQLLRGAEGGDRTAWLIARQSLRDRMLLAMLDVQTALAAIDCEGERGLQLRGQMQRIEARRVRNASLAGILIGAGTAVVGGALSLAAASTAADVVGIAGGSLESSVAAALLLDESTGRIEIRYNLIAEIWRQPEQSGLFPPTVWRYLTRRASPGAPSIADEIITEWRATGLLEAADPEAFLLNSGRLTISELERRDAMMDVIEVRVALMNRDLRSLLAEVIARPPPVQARHGRRP